MVVLRVVASRWRWILQIPMPDDSLTTMFKIGVGDPVFDEHGGIYRVTAKSEIMLNRPCYRMMFEDGSTFIADAEHEWLTFTAAERDLEGSRGTLRTTTKTLHQTLRSRSRRTAGVSISILPKHRRCG